MKKHLLFAVLVLLLARPTSNAQGTFAPVGAEWWYGGDCYSYDYWCELGITVAGSSGWTDHMQSVKDTTILGKQARMLAATRYQRSTSTNTVLIGKRDTFYVYNTGDTVFAYDKVISDFTALYVFNVAVGDTVCLRQPNSSLNASNPSDIGPGFCIIIDSIKLENYGGEQLRSYYNHTIVDSGKLSLNWGVAQYFEDEAPGYKWKNIGKYTEKIGGNWKGSGSFFPEKALQNPDYYKEIGFPTGTFRCYKDAGVNIKMTSAACDTVIVPLSIPGLAASQYHISVFPNPSSGTFRLSIPEPLNAALDLQVADLSGRILYRTQLLAGKTGLNLDLGTLGTGTYLLVLQAKAQRYYQKLVISH